MDTIIGGAIALISSVAIATLQHVFSIFSDKRKRKDDFLYREKEELKTELGRVTELAVARGFSSNTMFVERYQQANKAIAKEDFELARARILEISQGLSDISKLHLTLEKLAHLTNVVEDEGVDEIYMTEMDGLDRARYYDQLRKEQDTEIKSFFLWFYSMDGPKLYGFDTVQAELANISNEYQEKGRVSPDTLKQLEIVIKSELFPLWKPKQDSDDEEFPF